MIGRRRQERLLKAGRSQLSSAVVVADYLEAEAVEILETGLGTDWIVSLAVSLERMLIVTANIMSLPY